MIDVPKDEIDLLLDRADLPTRVDTILVSPDNSCYRTVDPTKDFPPGVYRVYSQRIKSAKAESLVLQAREFAELGNRPEFLRLRKEFYELTGYYF